MTRVVFAALALAACVPALHAQESPFARIDDETLVRMVERREAPAAGLVEPAGHDGKCGFALAVEAVRREKTLPADLRMRLQAALDPDPRQTSMLSPSGRFRIHFDTTGSNAPALLQGDSIRIPNTARTWAAEVATYFDEAYAVEVLQLGFAAPPFETGQTAYNVYVHDLGPDYYGQTVPVQELPNSYARPTYTTYIEIDNDFYGLYSPGLRGAQVTAAHEFNHVIQLGGYGLWDPSDIYFYEMTAVFFEDYVYPDVNDYRQYLDSFFLNPDRSMYGWPGYQDVLWWKFLAKRYDPNLVRETWEQIRQASPLEAMSAALQLRQSSLASDFCAYARWNSFTSVRASDTQTDSYDDASDYPSVRFNSSIALIGDEATFTGSMPPLSALYFRAFRGSDTAIFVVANVNITQAYLKGAAKSDFSIHLLTQGYGPDYTPVGNGWGYQFSTGTPGTLCLQVLAKDAVRDLAVKGAFPNPFHPKTDGVVRFPIAKDVLETTAGLYIYTSATRLVRRMQKTDIKSDALLGRFVVWDGRSDDGSPAASGVYLYTLVYGSTTVAGKIAVIER